MNSATARRVGLRVRLYFGHDALVPKPGSEHTVLLLQIVDHILLLAVDPASHNEQ